MTASIVSSRRKGKARAPFRWCFWCIHVWKRNILLCWGGSQVLRIRESPLWGDCHPYLQIVGWFYREAYPMPSNHLRKGLSVCLWWFDWEWPPRLIYLNSCSPVGRTLWKRLGSLALLEEVCHQGQALEFQKPTPFPVSSLCLMLINPDINS